MLFVLRKIVGNCEPPRLGADEDVLGRADGRIVHESPHGDMDKCAIPDDRIEQRAAYLAVRIVAVFVAKDHEVVLALSDTQSVAPDAGEWLEGRPSRPPTIRAVTVRRVNKFVRHRVMDSAAQALSGEPSLLCLFLVLHRLLLSRQKCRPSQTEALLDFKAKVTAVTSFMSSWLNSNRIDLNRTEGGQTVSHARPTVEALVINYFDGLYEGNADKLGAIFHPSADLRWLEKGELQILTVPDWLDRVRKRPSAKAEGKPREDFIVTIDRSDDSTAFIKVRCQLPPRYFTDYLVAMKLADGWKIVSKSYRYDLREKRPARLAPDAAGRDDLVGPAGKETLDHAASARQQPVRVAPLRHALAGDVGERKQVALQQRDGTKKIRQRPRGQQAAHARPDHNRMLADLLHDDAPFPRLRTQDAAGTGVRGAGCV